MNYKSWMIIFGSLVIGSMVGMCALLNQPTGELPTTPEPTPTTPLPTVTPTMPTEPEPTPTVTPTPSPSPSPIIEPQPEPILFDSLPICDQLDAVAKAGKSVSEFIIAAGQFNDIRWAVNTECSWHIDQLRIATAVLFPPFTPTETEPRYLDGSAPFHQIHPRLRHHNPYRDCHHKCPYREWETSALDDLSQSQPNDPEILDEYAQRSAADWDRSAERRRQAAQSEFQQQPTDLLYEENQDHDYIQPLHGQVSGLPRN